MKRNEYFFFSSRFLLLFFFFFFVQFYLLFNTMVNPLYQYFIILFLIFGFGVVYFDVCLHKFNWYYIQCKRRATHILSLRRQQRQRRRYAFVNVLETGCACNGMRALVSECERARQYCFVVVVCVVVCAWRDISVCWCNTRQSSVGRTGRFRRCSFRWVVRSVGVLLYWNDLLSFVRVWCSYSFLFIRTTNVLLNLYGPWLLFYTSFFPSMLVFHSQFV